jgi:predicted nucleic acid-binding protein
MSAVLCDSDFILSLLIETESTHRQASDIYQRIGGAQEVVLPQVHYEVVTVCSRKYGYAEAMDVHMFVQRRLKRVTAIAEEEVWQEFFLHRKKSISYVDCANLVAARNYGWKIASFDGFYPKTLRLT